MTISDGGLHDRLEDRARSGASVDVGRLAGDATRHRRRAPSPSIRLVGGVSVAASVIVAFAIVGGLVLRSAPAASPSNSHAEDSVTSPGPVAVLPLSTPWTMLVWSIGERAAFGVDTTTTVSDVIADGTGFIAVGTTTAPLPDGRKTSTGTIWRSADGHSWQTVDASGLENAALDRVGRVGDHLVVAGSRRPAVAGDSLFRTSNSSVWWSTDGQTWENRTADGAENLGVTEVAFGPDGVLMLVSGLGGPAPQSFLIADADLHWRRAQYSWPDDVRIKGLAAGPSGWLAFGATGAGDPPTMRPGGTSGAIWTSRDGEAWTPSAVDRSGGVIEGVLPVARGFLAYGDDAGLPCDTCLGGPIRLPRDVPTWFSASGNAWSRQATLDSGHGSRFGDMVTLSGPRIVGNGERSLSIGSTEDFTMTVVETQDGLTWHLIESVDVGAVGAEGADVLQQNDGPIAIGRDRIVAFHADPATGAPIPTVGVAQSTPDQPYESFAPRPLPTPNDVLCPNQLPCDDSNKP